jgi:hypothetical protein
MFLLPVSGYHGDGLVVTSGKARYSSKGFGIRSYYCRTTRISGCWLQSEMAAADY